MIFDGVGGDQSLDVVHRVTDLRVIHDEMRIQKDIEKIPGKTLALKLLYPNEEYNKALTEVRGRLD